MAISSRKPQTERTCGRMHQPALVVCVAMTILASTPVPVAADDRDLIPNQVAVRQFELYLDSLAPTRSQFVESVSLYKTYLNDFNHLRATEIEQQLAKRVTATDLAGMVRQYKRLMRKVHQLRRKVTRLDSSLFDSLQAIMSAEQLEQLEQLERARRHRIRQSAPIYEFFRSTGRELTDLSDVASRIKELDDCDRGSLDAALKNYELRLTGIIRRITRNVPDIQGDLRAGLLERKYDVDSDDLGQAYAELWLELAEPSLKLAQAVDELNARTYRSIESLLSDSGGGVWRRACVKAMYPHAAFIVRAELHAKKVKEQLVGITGDDRANLDYQLSETIRQLRDTLETLVSADNTKNTRRSPYVTGFGTAVQIYEKARTVARRSVSDLLKEQNERFKTELSDAGFEAWTRTSASVLRSSRSGQSRVVEEESIGHASSSFVPILQTDLNHYKELLALNEVQMNTIVPGFERYPANRPPTNASSGCGRPGRA